jgi:hypothetical protein
MKTTVYERKRVKAAALARAGIAKAMLDLKNDRLMAAADPLFNNDTFADIWADKEDKTDVPLGSGTYTVRVIDEDGKLDLNAIGPANQQALTYLLMKIGGMDDNEAKELTQAYLDYIDNDNRAMGDPEQTEAEYYAEWARRRYGKQLGPDYVFRPKNEGLISVEELLEIPGFTWQLLFGDPAQTPTDPIVRADWEGRSTALVDYLTAGIGGRVNVNTARLPVLEAILYTASGGASDVESWAKKIDDLRRESLKMSKKGGRGILDLGQLQNAGIDPAVLSNLNGMFQLNQSSHFFTIVSRGAVEGVQETRTVRCYVEVQRYPLDPKLRHGLGRRELRGFGLLKSQENFKIDPEVRVDRLSEL